MVTHIQRKFPFLLQRRACKVLGQPRSTKRHHKGVSDFESRLVQRILDLAKAYGRYGYRQITTILRREGWRVNHKRIERIWSQEEASCSVVSQKDRYYRWLAKDKKWQNNEKTTQGKGTGPP